MEAIEGGACPARLGLDQQPVRRQAALYGRFFNGDVVQLWQRRYSRYGYIRAEE